LIQFAINLKTGSQTGPAFPSTLWKSKRTTCSDKQLCSHGAGGNLATDGGDTFKELEIFGRRLDNHDKRIDENQSGVALAISIENPDLVGSERFGVAMNYGNFEGASALSWSAMGVLGYDVLSPGDRIAISGGFGVGLQEGAGDDVWGGRVGAQWTWGRKPAPYVLK
jgi:trimeric autotransporter adhesin